MFLKKAAQLGFLLSASVWLTLNSIFAIRRLINEETVGNPFPVSRKLDSYIGNAGANPGQVNHQFEPPNLRKPTSAAPKLQPLENVLQMHGRIGLDQDGFALWTPKEPPSASEPIAKLLRVGGGFNIALSDSLPMDRDVIDVRDNVCKDVVYDLAALPAASVIIVFYNEPFSTLMRSVHSVLNRTPPELLEEIVLVDDGGDLEWIREGGSGQLQGYVDSLPKTKLVRLPVRKGIVGARMAGIRASKSEIFVILDSHIEVNLGWLEPLVARIKVEPTHVMMPSVDGLDAKTFVPHRGGIGCTLGFLWKLMEHSFNPQPGVSPEERLSRNPTDYVTSPTMAGGLFAANKDFFFDIGAYDEKFEYWGTENVEFSFRLWQCGGVLECSQCSRVFHVFRNGGSGYGSPPNSVTKNKMRTLTVLMDEFADLAWRVIGKPKVDFGEYESRKNWLHDKGCQDFSWFLKNVNPEQSIQSIPRDVPWLGPFRNIGTGNCLDNLGSDYPGGSVGLRNCHGHPSQDFMYFAPVKHIHPIRNDETCLGNSATDAIPTGWCHEGQQQFDILENGLVRHVSTGMCWEGQEPPQNENEDNPSKKNARLTYAECDPTNSYQLWELTPYDPPKVFTPPPF